MLQFALPVLYRPREAGSGAGLVITLMTQKSEIGKLGEDLACGYLVQKRWKILQRNFRKPWGELDIIAKDPKGILVFVEVKAMRSRPKSGFRQGSEQFGNNAASLSQDAAIQPEDNLTAAKLKKIQRTSQLYASRYPELINEKKGWQIDLIAITLSDKEPFIKHFENI